MINDRYMELVKPQYKVSYLAYLKDAKKMDAFSTHQPPLIHMLNTIIEGEVLEFGMGWHSTPIMHLLCGIQGRNLLSVDTDKNWFDKFKDYRAPWHQLQLSEQEPIFKGQHSMFDKHYAIAFVDAARHRFGNLLLKESKMWQIMLLCMIQNVLSKEGRMRTHTIFQCISMCCTSVQ